MKTNNNVKKKRDKKKKNITQKLKTNSDCKNNNIGTDFSILLLAN